MDKILLIMKLIPVLIELIKAVEQVIPGEGKGEQKLVMVRELLEATDKQIATAWPAIAQVIAVLVKTFNTTGEFNK